MKPPGLYQKPQAFLSTHKLTRRVTDNSITVRANKAGVVSTSQQLTSESPADHKHSSDESFTSTPELSGRMIKLSVNAGIKTLYHLPLKSLSPEGKRPKRPQIKYHVHLYKSAVGLERSQGLKGCHRLFFRSVSSVI